MKSVRVSSRISPELKEALEDRAKQSSRSESNVIELALNEYLAKKEQGK